MHKIFALIDVSGPFTKLYLFTTKIIYYKSVLSHKKDMVKWIDLKNKFSSVSL
jgi:hypothetical protein